MRLVRLLRLILMDAAACLQEFSFQAGGAFAFGFMLFKLLYEIDDRWTGENVYDSWVIGLHAADLTCLIGAACCLVAALVPIWADYRERSRIGYNGNSESRERQ